MSNINIMDIAAVVGILASLIAIFRFHISLKNEIASLKIEIAKLNNRFDLLEVQYKGLKDNVDVRFESQNKRVDRLETEHKNFVNKFIDYLKDSSKTTAFESNESTTEMGVSSHTVGTV
jgi:hypothetical protein